MTQQEYDCEVEQILSESSAVGIEMRREDLALQCQLLTVKLDDLTKKLEVKFFKGFRAHASKDVLKAMHVVAPDYSYKSASKEFLVPYIQKHSDNKDLEFWGSMIVEAKSVRWLLSSLLSILKTLPEDNIFHPIFNMDSCPTGRIYASNPSITNWTNEAKRAIILEKDSSFLVADWKSQELRILAALSEDQPMINGFFEGVDPHNLAYESATDRKAETDRHREVGKVINYSICYGVDSVSVERRLNLGAGLGQKVIDRYFKKHPSVLKYIEKIKTESEDTHMVETYFGRKRKLSPNPHDEGKLGRQAVNTKIQGTAADMLRRKIVEVYEVLKLKGLCARILWSGHDSLILSVKDSDMEEVENCVREKMTEDFLGVPMEVEVKKGKCWQDIEDSDKEIEK